MNGCAAGGRGRRQPGAARFGTGGPGREGARLPRATAVRKMRRAGSRAGVAQLAERLICNQQVKGSSPLASSTAAGVRPPGRALRIGKEAAKVGGGRRGPEIRRYSRAPFAGEVSGRPKPLAQQVDRKEDFGRTVAGRQNDVRQGRVRRQREPRGTCRFLSLALDSPHLTNRQFAKNNEREMAKAQRARRGCGRRVRAERYRSGQTGQTVNLLAHAFGGSNPPLSTTRSDELGDRCDGAGSGNGSSAGIAQLARARAFQARGRGFESRFPLQHTRERDAHVAQSVEHVLGKDEVTGSIPVVSSSPPPTQQLTPLQSTRGFERWPRRSSSATSPT